MSENWLWDVDRIVCNPIETFSVKITRIAVVKFKELQTVIAKYWLIYEHNRYGTHLIITVKTF